MDNERWNIFVSDYAGGPLIGDFPSGYLLILDTLSLVKEAKYGCMVLYKNWVRNCNSQYKCNDVDMMTLIALEKAMHCYNQILIYFKKSSFCMKLPNTEVDFVRDDTMIKNICSAFTILEYQISYFFTKFLLFSHFINVHNKLSMINIYAQLKGSARNRTR